MYRKQVTRHDDLNLQNARSIPVNHTRVIPQSHDRSRAKVGWWNTYIINPNPLSLSSTTTHTCLEHPSPPPSYSPETPSDYKHNHEQWSTSHYLEWRRGNLLPMRRLLSMMSFSFVCPFLPISYNDWWIDQLKPISSAYARYAPTATFHDPIGLANGLEAVVSYLSPCFVELADG